MSDDARLQKMLDEHEIAALLIRWGHARDGDHWDTLADCFHDDATIHISWISDTAKEFVRRSEEMNSARQPGDHGKHYIGGPWIIVNGNRAFSRVHVNLIARGTIEGTMFDTTNWFRFFDLLEKRDGVWRIFKRTAVYEKDRVDPVPPAQFPPDFFDGVDLDQFPTATRFMNFRQVKRGGEPRADIPTVYSKEEAALRAEGDAWVNAG
jgi:hypothetical protein